MYLICMYIHIQVIPSAYEVIDTLIQLTLPNISNYNRSEEMHTI